MVLELSYKLIIAFNTTNFDFFYCQMFQSFSLQHCIVFNNREVTLAVMDIKTGRTHQIRSQAALHKHPLLGDTAYGGKAIKNAERDFYLQAFSLTFPENPIGLADEIKIPLSEAFKSILKECNINDFEI